MTRAIIREARTADAEIVGELIDVMDAHYNGAGSTVGAVAAVELTGVTIGDREGTRFLVAMHDERLACLPFELAKGG